MSGAYVAKPDAVISVDLPDGWNPLWEFPGPFPPGYGPDLSFVMSAPTTVEVGDQNVSVTAILKDQDEYTTQEPFNDSLTWTVSRDSEGGPEGTYSLIGGFYGDTGIYAFEDLTEGEIITITVLSDPFSISNVTASTEIEVVGASPTNTWKITVAATYSMSCTSSADPNPPYNRSSTGGGGASFYILGYPSGTSFVAGGAAVSCTGGGDPMEVTQAAVLLDSWTATATISSGYLMWTASGTPTLTMRLLAGAGASDSTGEGSTGDAIASYVVNIYKNDVLQETLNYSASALADGKAGPTNDTDGVSKTITFAEDGTYTVEDDGYL